MGIFGRLNRLFARGYAAIIPLNDLYPLDSNVMTEALYPTLKRQDQSLSCRPSKRSLTRALAKALLVPWLLPIPHRLCPVGFKCAQPLFPPRFLGYLETPGDSRTMKRNIGYSLIGAAASFTLELPSQLPSTTTTNSEQSTWSAPAYAPPRTSRRKRGPPQAMTQAAGPS
ncbi:hypothetical protein VUR80DRAFT_5145 [Thermomyces stellatus]